MLWMSINQLLVQNELKDMLHEYKNDEETALLRHM